LGMKAVMRGTTERAHTRAGGRGCLRDEHIWPATVVQQACNCKQSSGHLWLAVWYNLGLAHIVVSVIAEALTCVE